MNFTSRPAHSKRQINTAAHSLTQLRPDTAAYENARQIVNEYRTCHAYPLNTFKSTLRKNVRRHRGAIVAQRLKRLPTIVDKLTRYPTMKLTQMQDIGGLRAILPDIKAVRDIRRKYVEKAKFKHELILEHDYITNPKPDGYRGVHLVYRYQNANRDNQIASQYNGLPVEIQLRTQLQHIWATAVETVGMFRNASFKTGRGPKEWREFFELVSSAFAIAEGENALPQHRHMQTGELIKSYKEFEAKHNMLENLKGIAAASSVLDGDPNAGYYNIVHLDISNRHIQIYTFDKDQLDIATQKYSELEKKADNTVDVVLVSVENINTLKKAYPNYFLDVREFVEKISVLTEA